MPLFLGLDCGTQGLTAILLDAGRASAQQARIVFERSLEFDRDFLEYGTENGVHRQADGLTVTAPPLLWAAALDRMLGIIASSECSTSAAIEGICGSAQQHGTVYLTPPAKRALGALDAAHAVCAANRAAAVATGRTGVDGREHARAVRRDRRGTWRS